MTNVIDAKGKIVVCRRDRRLRAWPHWEEVELRLRHRWSPRQVVAWYRERWSSERPPSVPTLYRFLEDQEAGWFLPELVDTRRLPRVLALEEHAHLTITQLMRVKRAIARGVRIGNKVLSPGPFVVKCPREIANRLLSVAKRSCPDVVPEIRAAIEQDRATEAT
jgi:hypothetical protein